MAGGVFFGGKLGASSVKELRKKAKAWGVLLGLAITPVLVNMEDLKFSWTMLLSGREEVLKAAQRDSLFRANNLSRRELRLNLLMALDLFIRHQKILHQENGHYVSELEQVPDVFSYLSHYYSIKILRASKNQLLVSASNGRLSDVVALREGQSDSIELDRVFIDDGFVVRSNFPIPQPPRSYLRVLARSILQHFKEPGKVLDRKELNALEGVFRGQFRYEWRKDSQGQQKPVAIGLVSPVLNEVIEEETVLENAGSSEGSDLFAWVLNRFQSEFIEGLAKSYLEKIFYAQKIYQFQNGSFADSIDALIPYRNELSYLKVPDCPISIQSIKMDPSFGYQAEMVAGQKIWSINGYGQMLELASLAGLIKTFNRHAQGLGSVNTSANVNRKVASGDSAKWGKGISEDDGQKVLFERVDDALSDAEREGISSH